MGGHHLWVSKDIFYWQQSKEVLRSFANEGVLTSLYELLKRPHNTTLQFPHPVTLQLPYMQIRTPFTQQRVCILFFANLFLGQSVCPDLFLKASHLFRQISPCHAFSYKYTTMCAPLLQINLYLISFGSFFYTTFNVSIGSSRISPRTLFSHSQHTDYIVHCVSVLPKSPPCYCLRVARSLWQIPPCCLLILLLML